MEQLAGLVWVFGQPLIFSCFVGNNLPQELSNDWFSVSEMVLQIDHDASVEEHPGIVRRHHLAANESYLFEGFLKKKKNWLSFSECDGHFLPHQPPEQIMQRIKVLFP